MRYDVLSFLVTYFVITPFIDYTLQLDFLYLKFFMIICLFFNCLFYLTSETNDYYKRISRFNYTNDIKVASHVCYQKKNKMKKLITNIIKIERVSFRASNGLKQNVQIFYRHKIKYYWNNDKKRFKKVKPFFK